MKRLKPSPLQVLEKIANKHSFVIIDVPKDGNCMYSAVLDQLCHAGNQRVAFSADLLRQSAVTFLEQIKSAIYRPFCVL